MKTTRRGPIDLNVEQLLLDSQNPRIGSAQNQRDALQKLVDDQEDKLFALAESIVDDGMSPCDRLLVVREKKANGRYISIEGNRRIAALKLLCNPTLLGSLNVEASLQRRFEALGGRFMRGKVEPLACYEIENREEGSKWLHLRHTGQNEGRGVVDWTGLAAARFRGTDPALQALEFVKVHGRLTEHQRGSIDSYSFPISNLQRLLSNPAVRRHLGVRVTAGKLESVIVPEELMKPLRRIVLDLAEKRVRVNRIDTAKDQIAYVSKLDAADRADLSKRNVVRPVEQFQGSDFGAQAAASRPVRRTYNPVDRKTLAPRKPKLNVKNAKSARIYRELQNLKVERFPNASAVLLRVFLELSVDNYFNQNGLPKRVPAKGGRVVELNLKTKILQAVDHLVKNKGCDRKDFAAVIRGVSDARSPLNVDLLNAYVHNSFTIPKPSELKSAWDEAQFFFEKIWP